MSLKIVMIAQPRDTYRGSGAEFGSVSIVLRALADRLARHADVHVVAPLFAGQTREEYLDNGITVHRVPAPGRLKLKVFDTLQGLSGRGLPSFARDGYYPEYARNVAAVVARLAPDVVHLMTYPQFGGPIREKLPDVPLVLHLHDETLTRLPVALVSSRLMPFAAIVTCSAWLARKLHHRLPNLRIPVEAIGNGVDVATFGDGGHVPEVRHKLLFVGRISPEKGPHVLIDAFNRVAGDFPDLQLVLAGPPGLIPFSFIRLVAEDPPMRSALPFYGRGPLSGAVKQIIKAGTGLREELTARIDKRYRSRVTWCGTVPHDRIPGLMGERTIFVQPSICEEPFGLPLAEAMACGVPCIGSRRGGIPEIIEDDRTGLLVEAGDADGLASAIRRMLNDFNRAREIGKAGADSIAAKFSWTHATERLRNILDQIVDHDSARTSSRPAGDRCPDQGLINSG